MANFSNKTEILNFIKLFMHGEVDEDSTNIIYAEVLQDIAQSALHPLVGLVEEDTQTGVHTYRIPDSAIKILAAFHKARQLNFTTVSQLEAYDIDWRGVDDDPISYLQEEQSKREVRLFPQPISGLAFQNIEFIDTDDFKWEDTNDFEWQQTARLKELAFLFSEARETNIPEWSVLFIAFEIMARETAHPGEQQDLAFSGVCKEMANFLATF